MPSDDDDTTMDSFGSWIDQRARARMTGRLSVDDALAAYLDHVAGGEAGYEEAMRELSRRFVSFVDELSGELLFRAVIYV